MKGRYDPYDYAASVDLKSHRLNNYRDGQTL
jgi:hypothetical protein